MPRHAQDEDRVESIKAGLAAAIGGAAVMAPLLLSSPQAGSSSLLSLLGAAVSCLLFGVTYR